MLDRVKNALMPGALETERQRIQNDIDLLTASREEARLERGEIVIALLGASDPVKEREARRLMAAITEIDDKVAGLRRRRREIDDLTRSDTPVKRSLVDVPMPIELIAVQKRLDEARVERTNTIRDMSVAAVEKTEARHRNLAARLPEIEENIKQLRIDRERLLRPYYADVEAALAPLLRQSATKVVAAVQDLHDALNIFASAAELLPPIAGQRPSGIHHTAHIDRTSLFAIGGLASDLLANLSPESVE